MICSFAWSPFWLAPLQTAECGYPGFFADKESQRSLHLARWPKAEADWASEQAEAAGEILLEGVTAIRRYKSEASISLGTEQQRLLLSAWNPEVVSMLIAAWRGILSVTRARDLCIGENQALAGTLQLLHREGVITVGLDR